MSKDDQQKQIDVGVEFERVIYQAIVEALRNGARASTLIDNLHHHAKVVKDACKILNDVTGKEVGWP